MKALFIPAKYKKHLGKKFMDSVAKSIDFKKVGIFTTIQFMNQMAELKKVLESRGKKVFIAGQVLGCNVKGPLAIEKEVEGFIYLGSGIFHQLNLAVQTKKKIIQANPLTETVSFLRKEQIEQFKKNREQNIKKAMSGKVFGILVCTKPGQNQPKLAEKVKQFLEKRKKTVYMFLFDNINPDETYNFPQIDVWINTACYRIGLDDVQNYPKPIVNAQDLLEKWDKN